MNWLPIADAYTALVQRGMTEVAAAEGLTAKISTFALLIKPHRSFDKQYGPSWITTPIIDFRTGMIALPLLPMPGSWQELRPQLTPVLVDVRQDQFDSLWPSEASRTTARGHPEDYDWSAAGERLRGELDRRGDPTRPENQEVGWRSKSDLARLLISYLTTKTGEPSDSQARSRAGRILHAWQSEHSAGKASAE